MKTCSYCGCDNAEEVTRCSQCGCHIIPPTNGASLDYPETARPAARPLIDLTNVEGAFSFDDEFSRPDWAIIQSLIKKTLGPEAFGRAWAEVAFQWVCRLREDLGGNYHVSESNRVILLSALDRTDTQRTLGFIERAVDIIRAELQQAAWQNCLGKHVVLLFMDEDDYYQYQAPFLRDGLNPASGGVLIRDGYVHIALPYANGFPLPRVLAHELTHNYLAHLPLPLWLNEGVAQRMEGIVVRSMQPILDQELADNLRNYWTEKNIQEFWAGVSFDETSEARTLSYSLAEVLVHSLTGGREAFLEFLRNAHCDDAGQTAALDCMETNLGDLAGSFLGPGSWRPNRKAMVDCWKRMAESREDAHIG